MIDESKIRQIKWEDRLERKKHLRNLAFDVGCQIGSGNITSAKCYADLLRQGLQRYIDDFYSPPGV